MAKVKTSELLDALTKVRPGLANKEIVEHSTSFAFMGDRVVTFNDELAVSHPIKVGFEGAVQAEELHKLLTRIKDETLILEVTQGDEGSQLLIKGKKLNAGIRLDSEVRLPLDSINAAKKWNKLPENFLEGLRFVLFSASRDMTKPALTCVHVDGALLETCDQFRITRWKMKDGAIKAEVLIPAATCRALLAFKVVDQCVVDGWVHFRTEAGTILSARTIDHEEYKFPDLDDFLSVEGEDLMLPQEMVTDMLSRAGVFSQKDFDSDEEVTLVLEPGKVTVKAQGKIGWLEETGRIKYDGEQREVVINPQFLIEILAHLEETTVSENAMLFTGDNFMHAISLV
jgi:DNA polymerase III sliding clamp (beta) subunit (PCNA family)